MSLFCFFQAEDGIRDATVTGVQTCALPICALPKEFPPYSTVQGYFYRWRDDGTWQQIGLALVARARQQIGRALVPAAGIIDSQSVPTTEGGGPRRIDAGKRIKGRKRHIVTDTEGFLLAVRVHEANIQ